MAFASKVSVQDPTKETINKQLVSVPAVPFLRTGKSGGP